MNDDEIKALLQQRIDALKRLGVRSPVRVEATADEGIWRGETSWTAHGTIRGMKWLSVCNSWDTITSEAIQAVGPRGVPKEVVEMLLSL